jgi:hypothetical protein
VSDRISGRSNPVEVENFDVDTRCMPADRTDYPVYYSAPPRSRPWIVAAASVVFFVVLVVGVTLLNATESKFNDASTCGAPRHPSCEWVEQHYPDAP